MKRTTLITATLFALSFSSLTFAATASADESQNSWMNFSNDLQQKVDKKLDQQLEQANSQQVIHQLFRYNTSENSYVTNDANQSGQPGQTDINSAKLASK